MTDDEVKKLCDELATQVLAEMDKWRMGAAKHFVLSKALCASFARGYATGYIEGFADMFAGDDE